LETVINEQNLYEKRLIHDISVHSDEKSFSRLHELYYNKLRNVAFYYTGCRNISEEVVSDVLIKIWLKRDSLLEIRNLNNYLFISTKNQSLNYISKNKRVSFSSIEDLPLEISIDSSCPEELLINSESCTMIDNAVDDLPKRCKIIYQMVREEGLKHKQVAEMLGISVKTIEAQISIAIKKLSHTLNPYYI